ncbi:MAG: hypothetical protein IM574_13265 [Cytophagales bacterium]|jgi:hypothetical protein|nr:hypothetical protein [Cytophagales bacterium]MCA6387377.1 hypothetical protein [Cytophagales bacterium]MCA6390162.1 hypothetical protein [Cytophagales bacterium]MCA6393620.1 hypothetical protein [Cytophagales bacterium]MCA6397864.1 hypothetical protein [Cytophagales bacterium]
MIIKKLAAPLINEKLLQEAEHCYIASASISEAGFDFIRSRIPPKCKMDMVTGLDVPTSPQVLRRIWRNYQGRITLNIYTRNVFHANVYIFDLPFRKAVAFVGSGDFTLEGIKDREELFYKITDAKQIEELKSWFTGYFEFAEPLTEALIQEYELLYPSFKQREIASRQEKEEFVSLTTAGFSWEAIKFKNQFFKKEHYLTFANDRANLTTQEVVAQREEVRTKLVQLHDSIKEHVHKLKLFENADINCLVNSIDPPHYSNQKVRSLSISYGRGEAEFKKINQEIKLEDVVQFQLSIKSQSIEVSLFCGIGKGREDRAYLKDKMFEEEYRNQFFKLLTGLGSGYWIEVVGDKRKVESFLKPELLAEFIKADDWRYYAFSVATKYSPGDPAISSDNISKTMMQEFDKLVLLYRLFLKA